MKYKKEIYFVNHIEQRIITRLPQPMKFYTNYKRYKLAHNQLFIIWQQTIELINLEYQPTFEYL